MTRARFLAKSFITDKKADLNAFEKGIQIVKE